MDDVSIFLTLTFIAENNLQVPGQVDGQNLVPMENETNIPVIF